MYSLELFPQANSASILLIYLPYNEYCTSEKQHTTWSSHSTSHGHGTFINRHACTMTQLYKSGAPL